MRLFHSPQVEPLLVHLAQRLETPLDDPFAAEIVVVPSGDMARFLKRELARSLGARKGNDGIVSNINFVYPRQLVNATADVPTGPMHSEWDTNNLVWGIVDTLLSHPSISVPGFSEAPLTVASRAAALFDRYASHRPELLQQWVAGGVNDGKLTTNNLNTITKDQIWQKDLFIEVSKKFEAAQISSRAFNDLDGFVEALRRLTADSALPKRISVFGITTLSRTARHILQALSQVCDIHIYMVYAAGEKWPSPCANDLVLRSEFSASHAQNPLTKRWGAQIVENAAAFGQVERNYLPSSTARTSLLQQLQESIVSDTHHDLVLSADDRKATRSTSDGSLQIHACYGLARQVEALRDAFLHELNNNPQLQLRDFAVLCADIDAAAPIISAVFAPHASAGSTLPAMPINVLGNSASSRDPLIEAFLAVLQLLTSRCSPTDVLEVAHLPAVRRAFGFDDDALTLLSTWAEDLAIRYGLDAQTRAEHWRIPATNNVGTWDAALNRLMMGIAIPGEVDRIGPGGVVPYDGIGGSDMNVAGSVAEFIARVTHFVGIINSVDSGKKPQGLTIEAFCSALYDIIDGFLQVPFNESSSMASLHSAISHFQSDSEKLLSQSEATFMVSELVTSLSSYFNDERALFGNKFESITVAPLDGQQHVPFRVLAILGADERAFSGANSDGDDILANNPCVGDPIYSLDGRQRLLTAMMSAQDTLIITCTGADISNNKETPLAVPLQELIEFADSLMYSRKDNPFGTQQLVARHPRQNFDSSTLLPGLVYDNSPFTFDPQAKEAHDVLHGIAEEPTLLPPTEQPEPVTIAAPTLKNLVQVITNPAEFYMGTVLNARIPRMPASSDKQDKNITGDGIVNLTIDNLAWSSEGRSLLERLVATELSNEEVIAQWETVRPFAGVLPPGQLGNLIVSEIRNELVEMIALLPENLRNLSAGTDIDGTISFSHTISSMRIQNVKPEALVRIRYKRFNESLVLEPWLELAILTLITGGTYYEAHLVTRGPDSKQPPAHRHFALIGESPEERVATARVVIACVEGMHIAATNGALPYFERASYELSANQPKKASAALERDLGFSAAAAYAFNDQDAASIFGEKATDDDFAYLGEQADGSPTGRAQLYAEYVWGAFGATTIAKSGSGGESSDEDGADDDN
jgi:exodeoxyribonuclease V gamma subunit